MGRYHTESQNPELLCLLLWKTQKIKASAKTLPSLQALKFSAFSINHIFPSRIFYLKDGSFELIFISPLVKMCYYEVLFILIVLNF